MRDKKRTIFDFLKKEEEPEEDTYWTDERKIESAKRIIKKLGLEGELANEKDIVFQNRENKER